MPLKLLFAFLLCSMNSFAQESFSEEQILQKIDSVQSSPFSENMMETTAETLLWIQKDSGIEVLDIELFVNALKSSNRELAPFLIRSYFFGKVEYVLRNNSKEDDIAAKAAGLENMVNVYNQYLEKNPEAANAETNKLASLRGTELQKYISSFDNRDGLSYETAVVPKSIMEEYKWMQEHYPNASVLGKSLIEHEGRTYDVFELQQENVAKLKVFFDTSIIL